MGQTEWQRGEGCVSFGKLRVNRAFNRNFGATFFEIAASNIGYIGNGRANAECGAAMRFDAAPTSDEFDFAGAERVVHVKSECHALFASFRDPQRLR